MILLLHLCSFINLFLKQCTFYLHLKRMKIFLAVINEIHTTCSKIVQGKNTCNVGEISYALANSASKNVDFTVNKFSREKIIK